MRNYDDDNEFLILHQSLCMLWIKIMCKNVNLYRLHIIREEVKRRDRESGGGDGGIKEDYR